LSNDSTTTGLAKPPGSPAGPVLVVGAGRAGLALSRELVAAQLPFVGLWNRSTMQRPDGLGDTAFDSGSEGPPARWLELASLVILAVRDDVIASVAAGLQLRPGTTVLHLSGALASDILSPMPEGVFRGSYHPLQSFSYRRAGSVPVPPYVVAVEGQDEAVVEAEQLAAATGHRTVRLAAEQKAGYHAAAVMASNCLVALQAAASRVMAASCVDESRAWELLWPLVMGTISGLEDGCFETAMTGPIARGDGDSVRSNLRALQGDENAQTMYRSLSREALEVARSAGLSESDLERVRIALDED